jgi:YidC/Oxa1 family membrane protein insertase
MDRSTTLGYVLIFVLFVGFFYFSQQNVEEAEKLENQSDTTLVVEPVETPSEDALVLEEIDTNSTSEIILVEEKLTTIKNNLLSIDLTNRGGIPSKLTLSEYKRYDSSDLVLFEEGQNQFSYIIPLANGTTINSQGLNFVPSALTESSVTLTASLPNGAKFIQEYSLEENSYRVGYRVRFENIQKIVAPNNRYATIEWKGQIQPQEKTVKDERAATTIYYKYASDEDVDNLSETSDDDETLQGSIKWISFKQKFFNQTLIHEDEFEEDGIKIESKQLEEEDESYIKDLTANIYLPLEQDNVEHNMSWYYGPNHYQTLKKQDIEMQKMIPLGWGIFGWVNKLIVIPVFNWLEQYFNSYGIIILLLTLIIKLSLFFPMYKVYKSSAKMRLLKPELDEIKERTGGDMQKAQQEQMKLYKQAGVSPLGGCLPQLVQLPILFAMFRFFPASIELRQEKLWWAEDLSSYDSIYNFPNGFEIPFYGDHISLFTLMMTAVTLFYTVMNSQASGQMVGPMKTVMYIMPIMFLGFFNNYAAALSFYYFLSTCITIIQNFVIRKFVIDEDKLHKQIQDSKKKKVKMKKSGMQKRLEEMAKKRGIDPYTGKQKGGSAKKKK